MPSLFQQFESNEMSKLPRKASWSDTAEAKLKEVLLPATQRALTKDEAYRFIIVSATVMRQGMSIDASFDRILAEMFGDTSEIHGFTSDFDKKVEERIKAMGLRP